jgi:hypothetical protein
MDPIIKKGFTDFRKRIDYAFLAAWAAGAPPLSQPRVGAETRRDFMISS